MGVNSLPKTVTRLRRCCYLNLGPSEPEFSTLTTLATEPPCLQILSHVFTVSPDTELTPPEFALLLAGCGLGKGFWMGHFGALSDRSTILPVKR